MSAGVFTRARYESDYNGGEVHPIRVQPETLLLVIGGVTNAQAGGGLTNPISARSSGSKRTLGLVARRVTVQFTGAVPAGYKPGGSITLPVLTPAMYEACVNGATGTYLGVSVVVTNTYQESAK